MNMEFFEPLRKEIPIRNKKLSLKEIRIFILVAIFLLGQWGCASHSVEVRPQLGRIGVVSAQYTPAFEFEAPAKGWLGGTARGAFEGTGTFVRLVPHVILGSAAIMTMSPASILGALYAAGALVKGTGYMIVGPFYGAATAESRESVEENEAQLKAALVVMRIQETMRDHVVQAASVANVNLTVLDGQGPESSSNLLTYFPVQNTNIDSVLELRVNRVWLSSTNQSFLKALEGLDPYQELQINPPLSLGMEVRGRLIRTADKVVLYDNTWKYEGEPHVFAEWAANDAQLFAAHFERAYDELAGQLSSSIFR